MRKEFFGLAVLLICVSLVSAQSTKTSTHVVPTGKGWGVEAVQGMAPGLGKPYAVTTGNGINYHNGPVMHGTVNVYFIWYGNWTNGAHASDSQSTVTLLNSLFGSSGMNNSNYYKINTTYGDTTANVSGNRSSKIEPSPSFEWISMVPFKRCTDSRAHAGSPY